jgi:signal transduction histidine kinase/CheY-like chemotaxis protein
VTYVLVATASLIVLLLVGVAVLYGLRGRVELRLVSREQVERDEENERLHEQLARSQRLESVGQLAGGVAHDFNNLLAVILNYASFVIDDLPEGDSRRDDVVEIQRAAERARDLTHQLLVFSRRELTRSEVVDVGRSLEAARNLLRPTIGEHIDLRMSAAPPLWRTKLGAGQLEQVLVNLAVNARDAMPGGGVLELTASNVVIARRGAPPGLAPGRYVRLIVRDDGSGMSAETAARAFEPFFSTKPTGKGTGLGLATVYGIATKAGGGVEIESSAGEGTVVSLHLPATDEPLAGAEPERRRPVAGAGRRVLVVEDEEAVRALTVRLLREHGYEVIEAADGLDGVERCVQLHGELDLVVTDVVMPVLSGVELVAKLHELHPHLPVLYVSGYAGDVLPGAARPEDGAQLLQKPFSREALLRAVDEALGAPTGATASA